ncbi:MAG: aromatic amino acid lyase [Alphaproteobacteria bacterium]
MTVTLDNRRDFNLANYRRVVLGGESVRFSGNAIAKMKRARKSFIALLDSDRTQFIYGTTSGSGINASKAISPAEQRKAAAARGRRRNFGAGFGGGNLAERAVRGIIFARLANYIDGNAKTRPDIPLRIASMLERPLPVVPMNGQVWAGEILPMAHVMAALPKGDFEEGEPMTLGNGSPCSAGLVADVAMQAANRLAIAEQVFALSIEAMSAPMEAYDPDLVGLWGDPYEGAALKSLNRLLAGVKTKGRRFYQAPVSWRILPRVLGAARRAIAQVEEVAAVSLSAISDNPVYVLPDKAHPHGRAFSTGGYHNGMAYPAMDALNAAWADLCTLADHHMVKMKRGHVSLLPDGLVKPGQHPYSVGMVGMTQIDYLEEARAAAQRTFLPLSEGDSQNDTPSPVFLSYKKSLRAADCLDSMLAQLAVIASQALWATDRKGPPRLTAFLAGIRSVVAPLDGEGTRKLGEELSALRDVFSQAALSGSADFAVTASAGRNASGRKGPARKTAGRKTATRTKARTKTAAKSGTKPAAKSAAKPARPAARRRARTPA